MLTYLRQFKIRPRALAVGALGVVFGDFGTSPLYTVQTVFNPGDPHPVRVSTESVFGIVSLIFWSVLPGKLHSCWQG
jgi:KUP system potassium uptake protein